MTISEVTTRVQGSMDTYISKTTFIKKKIVEVLKLDNHLIRTAKLRMVTM